MSSREAFEKWAKGEGFSVIFSHVRPDSYLEWETRTLWEAWQAATDRAGKTRARKPRALSVYGTGALYGEQQYCFECGWREGAAAVRKAIRNGND